VALPARRDYFNRFRRADPQHRLGRRQPCGLRRGVVHHPGRGLDGGTRSTNLIAGGLGIAAGIALLVWPDRGLYTLAAFIGIFVIASGLLHIVGAFVNRHAPHWWIVLLLGVIEVPIGIWALRRPGLTLAVVVTLAGAWAIVTGIWQILIAFEVRNLPKRLSRFRPAV
jgi:uncharacterized membrane protein HdeD (DUF308 family)